jgi:hypothetical protein
MAEVQSITLTSSAWTDINNTATITEGTAMQIQKRGGGNFYIAEKITSAPASTDTAFIVTDKVSVGTGGTTIWCRAVGSDCTICVQDGAIVL